MIVEYYKADPEADCGYIRNTEAVYATAREADSGDYTNNTSSARNSYTSGSNDYTVGRAFITMDTSGIPDGANITAARLILVLGTCSHGETNSGQATLHVVEGNHSNPLVLSDFGAARSQTVSGGSLTTAEQVSSGDGIKILTMDLNATGIGWINKTGITKFCLRVSGDINGSTPTGGNTSTQTAIYGSSTPRIYTNAATSITNRKATLNGQVIAVNPIGLEVTYTGDNSVFPRGQFTYRKNAYPAAGSPDTTWQQTLPISQVISAVAPALDPDSLYWFKVRAENQHGVTEVVGPTQHLSFTTLDVSVVYPNATADPLRRVSGIKRTFWSGLGGLAVYQCELALGGMSITYVSPIGSRDIPSAVTPLTTTRGAATTITPSGTGYLLSDYGKWLAGTSRDVIWKLFGKQPTYKEWIDWKRASLEQGFVSWSY